MNYNIKYLKFLVLACFFSCFIGIGQGYSKDWVKAESEHFIFHSDVGEKETLKYLEKLEKFHFLLGALHNNIDDNNYEKFNVYFLDDRAKYRIIRPNLSYDAYGFVTTCTSGLQGFSNYDGDIDKKSSDLLKTSQNDSQVVLFHEYTHIFMLKHLGRSYPKWFIEGFAEYYSTIRFDETKAIVGLPSGWRYSTLKSGKKIKYQDIINENEAVYNSKNDVFAFYAQSWLLVHYLYSTTELKEKFIKYLDIRGTHKNKTEAFELAMGIKIKDLDAKLSQYLEKSINAQNYTIKKSFKFDAKITKYPNSAKSLLLFDAAVNSCPYKEDKEKLYEKITSETAKFPNDEYAMRVLANAQINLGHHNKAKEFYENQLKNNPKDGDALFKLGLIEFLGEQDQNIKIKSLPKARDYFLKSYKENPFNARNLFYLSQTSKMWNNPDENSVNAAIQAFNIEPAVDVFAINLINILIRKNDIENAKDVIIFLLNNPHSSEKYQTYKNLLVAIDNGAKKDELMKILLANN